MEWTGSDTSANHGTVFVTLINGTGIIMRVEDIEAIILDIVSTRFDLIDPSSIHVEVYPVLLEADETVVTQRLTEREIGGELQQHLISTRNMDRVLREWTQAQSRTINSVSSEGRDVRQVAVEVLNLAGVTL